jgi:hypothetical protein
VFLFRWIVAPLMPATDDARADVLITSSERLIFGAEVLALS